MKANELRIGNFLIELGNEPEPSERMFKITAIYGRSIERFVVEDDNGDIMNASFLMGIPLTEEWLLRFGFEQMDLHRFNREISILNTDRGMYFQTIRIKYVHQLQNLYFALTGEELTYENT